MLYESYIHPITILSALPSAGVGALLALMMLHYDLSVIAMIGVILLIGIVKKNAIMMIDFALQAERIEGKSPREAIHQACLLRFRPIMMTTFAALFGAHADRVRPGRRLGVAPAARHRDRRRAARVAMADALHDAGHLSLPRAAVAAGSAAPYRPSRMARGADGRAAARARAESPMAPSDAVHATARRDGEIGRGRPSPAALQPFGFLVHDVSRLIKRRFERRARQMGLPITRQQAAVVLYIARNEGVSQAEVATWLDIEPIALVRMLDKLHEEGLVERRAHPTDRRVPHIVADCRGAGRW